MSAPEPSQRREALFRRIAGSKGGAAAMLLDPSVLAAAEVKLNELKPLAVAEIEAAIARIRALAGTAAGADEIFATAHDVRGMAGAYGFAASGAAAGAIRAYGENRPEGFLPDWDLLRLLAQMLARTFEQPEAAQAAALASVCREALVKVMTREGREPPLESVGS